MQVYMEWAKKLRASPITEPAMREMLQIIKVDERPTGVAFPSDRLWAEYLYRYAPSARIGMQLTSGYDVEKKQQSRYCSLRNSSVSVSKFDLTSFLAVEHANS